MAEKKSKTRKSAKKKSKKKARKTPKPRKKAKAKKRRKTAKKKKATRKTVRKSSKAKTAKRTKKSRATKKRPTVASLAARVDELEAIVARLGGSRERASLKRAKDVTIKFEKAADSPDLVRLSIAGTEVIGPTEKSGSYDAPAGKRLVVKLEANKDDSDTATINVANGIPSKLILKVRADTAQDVGQYPLWGSED